MLARDFGGIAFGLRARLRLIERRALRGLGIVLRVFRFHGLHASLRFFSRIGHSLFLSNYGVLRIGCSGRRARPAAIRFDGTHSSG
jgi:hypothetical protein